MLGLAHIFIFLFSLYSYSNHLVLPLPCPPTSLFPEPDVKVSSSKITLEITSLDALKLFAIGFLLILFLLNLLSYHCATIRFVNFSTNLSLIRKRNKQPKTPQLLFILLHLQIILLNEKWYFILILLPELNFKLNWKMTPNLTKKLYRLLFLLLTIHIFYIAINPCAYILSLMVFHNCCCSFIKNTPAWLSFLLIILSHDIHQNPGPIFNSYFTFMSWNLNSLAKDNFHRLKLLEADNSNFKYDMISLGETSLNDTVVLPNEYLPDYTFIPANKPDGTRHGGVGLYYKTSLPLKVRNDLAFDESIVVELNFGRKKMFFTVLYRSPSFNHTSIEFINFLSNFRDLCTNIKKENPYVSFFAGDFNAKSQHWWPDGDTTPEGTAIETLLSQLGLVQIISEPTNFEPNKNPSCIDLIITDQPNLILDSGTRPSPDSFCHHQITYCKININLPPPPPYEREIWHYHRADIDLIRRSMSNFPWLQKLNTNINPNWQAKTFTEIFLNIMSNFIPHEIKKIKPRDPPWITKPLKSMLNRKNRLFKNFKKHGFHDTDKVRLDNFRKECQNAVEEAKKSYLSNLGKKLATTNSGEKSYWKIINTIMNKCKAPKIPPLLVNNILIVSCKEKAKMFTQFFCQQCSLLRNASVLPNLIYITDERIDHIPLLNNEIKSLIRSLNPNKASGPDGISSQMLLLCDETVVLPLQIIFRNILRTGIYPDMWKLANVTPVYKKNNKQLINNYRPISLLPICGKILEKIIFNHLYRYLTSNDLITKNQSGFRPGDSTTNQLLDLVDTIHRSFEATPSLEVRAIFLDISKAFDKVWHEGLIFKLKQNGVSGILLKLFKNYLNNRKQRVVLNGSSAEYSPVNSGVPQGSVLGPLLFLVYINDLEKNIRSNVKFFADDTMLFSIVNQPTTSADDLNHDLEKIKEWAYQWKLEFNPDPTKQATEVLFSQKRSLTNHPPLFFNGNEVRKVNEQKHLGLFLDNKLSFKRHIDEKITKVKKTIGILKHLSNFLPFKTLDLMYKALVRPHFDYCDIIYHKPSKDGSLTPLMEEIEKVQYQAGLAITGAWQGSNRNTLYENLGWESLSDRRFTRRVLQLFKISTNLTPPYLSDKLPPLREVMHWNVNQHLFRDIRCKTLRYKNSFFPNAINSWNNIVSNLQQNVTLRTLQSYTSVLFRPIPKSVFNIHDPRGIKYIFQLRMKLSPLRSHKKRYNFADTPTDICECNQAIENTRHFLFECLPFAIHRVILAINITDILNRNNFNNNRNLANNPDLYLYGHRSLNISDNKSILLATIRYIRSTQRFSTE